MNDGFSRGSGHSLKVDVVAEGLETEEQLSLLRLLNCDEMQGFLFSKAVPGEIFEISFLTLRSVSDDGADGISARHVALIGREPSTPLDDHYDS